MFTNLSKEEAISGLLDTTKKITGDWLKANPECRQTEPVYFYWAKNSVQYSHELDEAISDLADEDNRYQVLLISPYRRELADKGLLLKKVMMNERKTACCSKKNPGNDPGRSG